jgi:hypothetical protein
MPQPRTLKDELNTLAVRAGLTTAAGGISLSLGLDSFGHFVSGNLVAGTVNGALCAAFGYFARNGYAVTLEKRNDILGAPANVAAPSVKQP